MSYTRDNILSVMGMLTEAHPIRDLIKIALENRSPENLINMLQHEELQFMQTEILQALKLLIDNGVTLTRWQQMKLVRGCLMSPASSSLSNLLIYLIFGDDDTTAPAPIVVKTEPSTTMPFAGQGHGPADVDFYSTMPFAGQGHGPADVDFYSTMPFAGQGHGPPNTDFYRRSLAIPPPAPPSLQFAGYDQYVSFLRRRLQAEEEERAAFLRRRMHAEEEERAAFLRRRMHAGEEEGAPPTPPISYSPVSN